MPESFHPDATIATLAEERAAYAIDFAAKTFNVALDWTDGSIEKTEAILAALHEDMLTAKPSSEQVFGMAQTFGSYVGEVFRRNHGAEWGNVTLEDQTFPGMRASVSAQLFWPWGRVQNRLVNGAEDNVWHYYQLLLTKAGASLKPESKGRGNPFNRFFKR